MSIASIGSSNFPQVTLPAAATGAPAAAKPDTDAPAPAAAAKEASGGDAKSSGGSSGSGAGESMFKINPDGTMGPLHMPRPGHVVHA